MPQLTEHLGVACGLSVLSWYAAFRLSRASPAAFTVQPGRASGPGAPRPTRAAGAARSATAELFTVAAATASLLAGRRHVGRRVKLTVNALWDKEVPKPPPADHANLLPKIGTNRNIRAIMSYVKMHGNTIPPPGRIVKLSVPEHLVKTTADMQRNRIWEMPKESVQHQKILRLSMKPRSGTRFVTSDLVVMKGQGWNKAVTKAVSNIENGTPKMSKILRQRWRANPNWNADSLWRLNKPGIRAFRYKSGMVDNRYDPNPKQPLKLRISPGPFGNKRRPFTKSFRGKLVAGKGFRRK